MGWQCPNARGLKVAARRCETTYNERARTAPNSGSGLARKTARDLARAVAQRALEQTREHTERGNEASTLHLLGEIAAQHDPPDVATAEAHYRAAMTLATELGMRPLLAHCHLGLGTLAGRTGDRAKAEAHLTTAKTHYREMDMRFWLEQAEAELQQLG